MTRSDLMGVGTYMRDFYYDKWKDYMNDIDSLKTSRWMTRNTRMLLKARIVLYVGSYSQILLEPEERGVIQWRHDEGMCRTTGGARHAGGL